MCFGPMVPDGYGVCYNPMEEHINIAITAFNSCEETNAANFAQAVEEALLDMRALLEDTATAKQWFHTGTWHGVFVPPPGCGCSWTWNNATLTQTCNGLSVLELWGNQFLKELWEIYRVTISIEIELYIGVCVRVNFRWALFTNCNSISTPSIFILQQFCVLSSKWLCPCLS